MLQMIAKGHIKADNAGRIQKLRVNLGTGVRDVQERDFKAETSLGAGCVEGTRYQGLG